MSRRRKKWNAICNEIEKPKNPHEFRPHVWREQWVVDLVTRTIGLAAGSTRIDADDLISDLLLELINAGAFSWEEDEIVRFVRGRARRARRSLMARRELPECEFAVDQKGEAILFRLIGATNGCQEQAYEAGIAVRLVAALPNKHREALEILADGGNPIHVAEECGLKPWEAIALIKEARDYVTRVDPVEDR